MDADIGRRRGLRVVRGAPGPGGRSRRSLAFRRRAARTGDPRLRAWGTARV